MFNFFHKPPIRPPTLEALWSDISKHLLEAALHSAFEVFQDQKFRAFLEFENQSKIEQDRIFNELEVTVICLLLFIYDDYLDLVQFDDPAKKQIFIKLREFTPKEFTELLAGLGIEQKHLDIWEKLLDLRMDEYLSDIPEIEAAFRKLNHTFAGKDAKLKERRLQILAVGCQCHICRGQIEGKDDLYNFFLHWLKKLDSTLTMPFNKSFNF